MAEVSEYMPQYGVSAATMSKFIGAPFTEATLVEYMTQNQLADLEMLIQEVARDGSR